MNKNYILALSFLAVTIGVNAQTVSSDDPIFNQNQTTTPNVNSITKDATISGSYIMPCDSGIVSLYSFGSYHWSSDSLGTNVITTDDSLTTSMIYDDTTIYVTSFEGDSLGELVLPAGTSDYSGNVRGYYFTAPVDFVITALRVPTTSSSGTQNISIVKFNNNTPPPLFATTTNDFVVLGEWQNYSAIDTIFVNLPVTTGDIIGIYGNRDDINSYAAAPAATTIGGIATTLTRSGMQLPLSTNSLQDVFSETGGSISRVDMYYDLTPDTVVTEVNITVPQSYDLNISSYYCLNDSILISGVYYDSDTTFTLSEVTAVSGCDSISNYTVSLNVNDMTVAQSGFTLTSNQAGATYLWLDCNNGDAPVVPSATSQSFTPTTNGDYRVVVTQNGCSDTSACASVAGIGYLENTYNPNFILFPNPTSENVTLDFGVSIEKATISIYDISGKLIYSTSEFEGKTIQLPTNTLSKGSYVINVSTEDFNSSIQLIKK